MEAHNTPNTGSSVFAIQRWFPLHSGVDPELYSVEISKFVAVDPDLLGQIEVLKQGLIPFPAPEVDDTRATLRNLECS